MLLLSLKDYIEAKKRVSIRDISLHFHIPEKVAEDMLKTWVVKGVIIQQQASESELPSCIQSKDCPRCQLKEYPESTIMYSIKKA